MIDHEMRLSGIGASEIAALVGLSPYQTAFDVWAKKVGMVNELPSTGVQRRGKYFERGIAEWYSDFTGKKVEWFDQTIRHPERDWQLASPDAWIVVPENARSAEAQMKTVNWRNADDWGDSGSGVIPDHHVAQSQWTMSTANTPYGDIAALLGMDDLRVYTIERDPKAEEILLEVADHFWRHHVLARNPPIIGATESAANFLKQRFPKETKAIRAATPDEADMLERYRQEREAHQQRDEAEKRFEALKNQVKYLIGDNEGISYPDGSWVDWTHEHRSGYSVEPNEIRVLRYHKPKKNIRRR